MRACDRQAEVFAITVDDLDLLRAGVPLDVLIVVRVTFIGPIQAQIAKPERMIKQLIAR